MTGAPDPSTPSGCGPAFILAALGSYALLALVVWGLGFVVTHWPEAASL